MSDFAQQNDAPQSHAGFFHVFFSAGHRSFFLFTVLSAIVFMALWLWALFGGLGLTSHWHAHEMLFGFAGAAIGGFLLAAVPKWTAAENPAGLKVAGLFALWAAGRLAVLISEIMPELAMIAWLDVVFLPVITLFVARMIYKAGNKRNFIVPAILVGLSLSNLGYHLGVESSSIGAGIYMTLLLAALIGGRVVPAFTESGLRMRGQTEISCPTPAWTHPVLMGLITLAAVFEYIEIDQSLAGGLAALTALVLCIRMKNWHSLQSVIDPIIWILHVAYLALPIGFALKALSLWTDVISPVTALHGLGAGAIALLIVAVATRAALGHSGRALKVSRLTVVAYATLILAVCVRVGFDSMDGIMISGLLWMSGFCLLAIVYGPILMRPRIDGQPG